MALPLPDPLPNSQLLHERAAPDPTSSSSATSPRTSPDSGIMPGRCCRRSRQRVHYVRPGEHVIAHRLFSAHDADRVAVVEDGRITELGSHDELVAEDGSYAALWRSWQDGGHQVGTSSTSSRPRRGDRR